MKDVNILIENGANVKKALELFGDMETYDAQMIKSVAADGDATAFMTDHFSLYVTADTEEIICYEVNFYYPIDKVGIGV